jgi:hypothetical protein
MRCVESRGDRVEMVEEEPASLGQRDRARLGPVDQPLADDALERGDLLADGGLGVPEPARRTVERRLFGDRLERVKVAQVELDPPAGGRTGGSPAHRACLRVPRPHLDQQLMRALLASGGLENPSPLECRCRRRDPVEVCSAAKKGGSRRP